ncbi:helix-turn-helix transcriptional regulator [Granulicella sibirica]|uniref:Transcriptional regulator, AraC family n=1 Tax=Granulicella sibirica TaxID=2479048 RepID=A0A4Q0T4J5_9BACT|nr:AraC family transcriptional regulator [Granulicella sibirica]RXH57872.1 Transcriptional regulator, AraC family [Granulicella sibirica]
MAAYLGVDVTASVVVKTKRKATLAVTRMRSDRAFHESTSALPAEPAFLVNLYLKDVAMHRWLLKDGADAEHIFSMPKGGVGIVSLERGDTLLQTSPFDCLQFYVSRAALDEIADEHGARRVETLKCPRGKIDPVINQLAATILEAMKAPGVSHRPFLDHALLALLAHFARVYGEMRLENVPARGGLAPWQTRRAVEILTANIEGELCMAHVARECELSVSYFVRAFKQTMGIPPYRWLTEQRIKRAKELLLHPAMPMAEIAIKCGFADQACFIRAFKRTAEGTPGEWRRAHRAH